MSTARPSIKFGVFVPQGWRMDLVEIPDPIDKYETMTKVAQEADRGGWDSIWVFDHFHTVPTPELETTFECWTITAGLARDTKNVKIGQMVTCNGYRNPALLAKIASTVDVMSHGRLLCGLGAGWYEHEWKAYGYGFPETRDRMGAFREACEIVHRMWTEDYPVFHLIIRVNGASTSGSIQPDAHKGRVGGSTTPECAAVCSSTARYADA